MRTVIYPGSFDPLMNGHLDVIQRAAVAGKDFIVVLAGENSRPARLASLESDGEVCILPGVAAALGWKGWATPG